MTTRKSKQNKDTFRHLQNDGAQKNPKGNTWDEAPRRKDVLLVLIIIFLLIAITWVAYFKFGWLH